MRLVARVTSFLRTFFQKERLERDLDDELQAFVRDATKAYVSRGLDPDEARRRAQADLGAVQVVKEEVRDARLGAGLETTLQDARYAWRGLRRAPAFTAVAVLTLGIGIGANTAIFSLVRGLLLSPLPYRDATRLVFVWSDMTAAGYPRAPLSGPELLDLRERTRLFDGFGAIWATSAALTGDDDPEQLRVGFVTADFFPVLGAEAAHGRTFVAGEEGDGAPPAILLSHGLWQRRYGGDRGIVGRRILVDDRPTTVVGVLPADFRLLLPPDASVPDDLQAFLPLPWTLAGSPRGQQFLRVVGRMKRGAGLPEARAEVASVAQGISTEFTEYGAAGRRYDTVGLQADGTRDVRPMLLTLFGGVAILLAIACVNVAGLLIARAAARQKEITLRAALGASRARLMRQCLVEGLLLAFLGGVAGVVVGQAALAGLLAARPQGLERMGLARIDTAVLGFTALVALGWGVILSIAPLAEVHRTDLARALQRDGWQGGGPVRRKARTALVVVQIALGTVLLVSAGLVARTFLELRRVDPGFRSDGVLTFRLALPRSRYASPALANDATRRLQEALAALPGVTGAGALSHLPFDHLPNWGGPYVTEAGAEASTAPMADYRSVTPGLFETLGARLVEGRDVADADGPGAPAVVVVDETLARRTWPGASALGRRLAVDPRSTGDLSTWATVVGVVRHVRHRSLAREVREQIYFPQAQVLRNPVAWVVKADGDPARLAPGVREAVAALDPRLPVYEPRPLAEYVEAASAAQRFSTLLAIAFATVALGLAVLGLYGVIAYSVARRRQEFGVRLAIGARASQVQSMVVGEGMGVVLRGLALGLPAAAAGAWLLRDQLFAVAPGDLATWATAVGVLAAAALAASWTAARRATAASPMDVLRAN